MTRNEAIAVLNRHADALRSRGVRHAALFGSAARGQSSATSDLDILIELDPDAALDAYAYAGLKRYIAELFPGPVDVVNKDALKPHVRGPATADAVYAF
jgi:predicted nucleotidyltransferase